jgi:hypothetical protein
MHNKCFYTDPRELATVLRIWRWHLSRNAITGKQKRNYKVFSLATFLIQLRKPIGDVPLSNVKASLRYRRGISRR